MKILDIIKDYSYLALVFLIVIFMAYFFISRSSYINIIDSCKIQIKDDLVRGNKETILQAIKLLNQKDRESYATLCRYIDTVKESYCPISINNDDTITYSGEMGCYIKGSKTININPVAGTSEDIIKQRAESLKKYARFSKDFWNNFNK